LIDVARIKEQYYSIKPDFADPKQQVKFGTSGHRGKAEKGSFNKEHILAVVQAVCDYRKGKGIDGPIYLGKDTHALSGPAQQTALEVLAANGIEVLIQENDGFTPTPVISHAILTHNRGGKPGKADGIVITPSHNPPEDGGIKYNPPTGGPADTMVTDWIERRANKILAAGNREVKRIAYEKALSASTTHPYDYISPYVAELGKVINMEAIKSAGLSIGADPMGGSGLAYWAVIAEKYGLKIDVVNPNYDPTFGFMTVDKDGKIRMDCSSPYAMASLIKLSGKYDIAFGNDPDFDRHGIVTRSTGLMDPNHYLTVAIWYLFQNRPGWSGRFGVGKTAVSSSLIDRVAARIGRKLYEVPVGFKWFVDPLLKGTVAFGGEESAGATFLRQDGSIWTTDKDGIIMALLAAEILAVTGKDPGIHIKELQRSFGQTYYKREDVDATIEEATALRKITREQVKTKSLAGSPIVAKITVAPGNSSPLEGIKIVSKDGSWIAIRPSGTEPKYKIYAESFKNTSHLERLFESARQIVAEIIS
jgi:phosphoglucomutase